MKQPQKIRLTNSPISKNVNLIPLPSKNNYPDTMEDDIYIRSIEKNENNKQDNSESISELDSL